MEPVGVGRSGFVDAVQAQTLGAHDGDGVAEGSRWRYGQRDSRTGERARPIRPDDVALEQQRVAQEAGDERAGGMRIELGPRPALHDATAFHHGNAVADHESLALVVGDVDDRHAQLSVDAGEFQLHRFAKAPVQGRKGFVEEQDAGLVHQRPGQGHPLALPAAQLADVARLHVGKLHQSECAADSFVFLLLRNSAQSGRRKATLSPTLAVQKKCQRLEHHAEIACVWRPAAMVSPPIMSAPWSASSSPAMIRSETWSYPIPTALRSVKNSPLPDLKNTSSSTVTPP